MKIYNYLLLLLAAMPICAAAGSDRLVASPRNQSPTGDSLCRRLYLPEEIYRVPEGNNFDDAESEYSYHRMKESPSVALFWRKEMGDNPAINEDESLRFDPDQALAALEHFCHFFSDTLGFVVEGESVTQRHKALLFVLEATEGTAFGGGAEDVGVLWSSPSRMSRAPFCTLAHELGHSFQYLLSRDGCWAFTSSPEGSRGNTIFEMTSQFMLWQVYPEWINVENYHWEALMKKNHYAFMHETNQYHDPYILEYWAQLHGRDFIGRLWREAVAGEDPAMVYKRLTGCSQEAFNDCMFDGNRRLVTYDLERIREVSKPYANRHFTYMEADGEGWYRVAESNCPQNYGYNGIQLDLPVAGTEIRVDFEGLAGAEGYRAIDIDKAGWRYGLVAYTADEQRVYSEVGNEAKGALQFEVPAGTTHLWLVVMGAPTQHSYHLVDGEEANDEQWPYRIRLTGTKLVPVE